jgi:hypothetical protein
MRRSGARILLLLLLGLFAAAAYMAVGAGAEAGRGLPEYSVFSNERNGLATAGRVLRKLGFQPVALTHPIQQTHDTGLLILIEPRQRETLGAERPGLSERDSRALLEWVAKGNTLVLMGRHTTELHEALGVSVSEGKGDDDRPRVGEATEVGGYTEPGSAEETVPVRRLGVEGEAAVHARGGLPLWLVGDRPGAVVVPHGEGWVLVIADPSLWTHRGLLRDDNVLFLYNVAALDAVGRRVYFDEYHHGLRSGGGYWDYLRYHDLHWNVLQLLAVAGVAVWAAAVRLGPAVPLPNAGRADAVDYASAVARIYQRAGVPHLLAQNMVRDFLGALTAHLRLRRTAAPAQLLGAWRQRHGKDSAGRLAELLRGVSELRKVAAGKEMTERELLSWSRAFDVFLEENHLAVRAE